jgi:hypothetical protein
LILGDGVAACSARCLLERAGLHVLVENAERPKVPAVMLSESTQKLFQDIFERNELFHDAPRIRNRVVSWGPKAAPVTLPHSAVVVSERRLLDRLQSELPRTEDHRDREASWRIFTSRPSQASSAEHHFGSRMATASAVRLRGGSDLETCWVESIEEGWLFLLPGGESSGWLLSVGAPPQSLLAGSRVVAEQISEITGSGGKFPSHPRIADSLCEAGWITCGAAALGFDPLCGDGAGHAAREAILASAVVRAAADGADVDSLVAHYRTRLLGGFKRHLEVCREFYRQGRSGQWWDEEVESTRRGLEWCDRRLDGASGCRYRLNGFSLERTG